MTAWNSSTNVGTFQIWSPWVFANYGVNDLTTATDMQAEVAAVTTLYAAERVVVAQGMGIALNGIHVENPSACSSLFIAQAGWGGATTNEVKNPYLNYDPSLTGGFTPSFIANGRSLSSAKRPVVTGTIMLQGGNYGASSPLLVETGPYRRSPDRRCRGCSST